MKPKHIVLSVLALAVLALIAVVGTELLKNMAANKKADADKPDAGSGSTGSTGTGPTALDYDRTLGLGSKGAEVSELQRLFNETGFGTALTVDGIFGAKTATAVMTVRGVGVTRTNLTQFISAIAEKKAVASKSASSSSSADTSQSHWYGNIWWLNPDNWSFSL